MKKVLLVILIAVLAACAVMLTACNRDSDRINEDSDILSVSVTAADGFTFELDEAQTDFLTSVMLRTSEFESDSKTSVIGWEFAYDYKIRITVLERKFLFKKEEKVLSYAFGTTKTRTNALGEQISGYYDTEWTNFSTITGSRSIANSGSEDAAAVHEFFENIILSKRQQNYESMKAQFEAEGFELRDLPQNEISGMYVEEEYIYLNAKQGFEATKQSTGESYRVYYVTVDKALEVYGAFHGKDCRKNDVFVGCGTIPQAGSILDRVFAAD